MPAWRLLHEDAHLLALCKPPGLLTVPGRGPDKQDCLLTQAQQHWPEALLVHRLDQATSGIVLLALSLPTQRALSRAFEQRQVHKRYEALVHGQPAAPGAGWQCIDLPLIVDWPRRPRSKVDHHLGKPSQTLWRPLPGAPAGQSRLALRPITGRSHQLRVHLLALGHPIVGDTLYQPHDRAPRLMLHACALALRHPANGQRLALYSPAPF